MKTQTPIFSLNQDIPAINRYNDADDAEKIVGQQHTKRTTLSNKTDDEGAITELKSYMDSNFNPNKKNHF